MAETFGHCVILTTCPSREEAHRLASLLVRGHLAACVQITEITSCYEWKGEVKTEPEQLLFIKALSDAFGEIERLITENHSYEVPEIVQIPIERGYPPYLRWIDEVTNPRSILKSVSHPVLDSGPGVC